MFELTEIYRQFLDSQDIGIFIIDKDSKYLYVNDAYCNLISKDKDFCFNTSIKELKAEGFLKTSIWDIVMQKKKTVNAMVTITDWLIEKTYDVLTTATPHFDESGEIDYIFYTQESVEHIVDKVQTSVKYTTVLYAPEALPESKPIDFIAESPQMKHLVNTINSVATTDASILINGPSGTGKEVLANYIHRSSLRKNEPLVVLNCGAIPESLMESELFGYEKGAFTGANSAGKAGVIEMADGGTLFLDEINSMPKSMQTKLLRVLETKTITRIGSTTPKSINFRLICATNENLQLMVTHKEFRQDLFYRINVISVTVPPLCERNEDIAPLAQSFLSFFCKKYNRVKYFSDYVLEIFNKYSWPGNVRELRNVVERIVITSPAAETCINVPPAELLNISSGLYSVYTDSSNEPLSITDFTSYIDWSENNKTFKECMNEKEKELLMSALEFYKTPMAVSKALKMDLSNVYKKMNKYNISI